MATASTSAAAKKAAAKKAAAKTAAKKAPAKEAASTKTTAATKSAAKKTATKTATKSAAKEAPAKKSAAKKTAAKTAAKTKTAAKEAPAKKTARRSTGKPDRPPVMFNGKPAANRHFLLDRGLYTTASRRCRKDGVALSDVLRHGLAIYGADAPEEVADQPTSNLLPPESLEHLQEVWASKNSERMNHYVAALHRGGWTTQAIADSLVASGAVNKISRQAVSLRILQAPEELLEDLPPVPSLGPRRQIVSARKGRKGPYKARKKSVKAQPHDFSFRVADEDYERAARRAKHEGAMMSGVLDEILTSYIDGEYDDTLLAKD